MSNCRCAGVVLVAVVSVGSVVTAVAAVATLSVASEQSAAAVCGCQITEAFSW